ncbi:cytochrome P450 [Mycena sanguinolenta]|nr:cytochrome P450 [Mycena sanguinolenta]
MPQHHEWKTFADWAKTYGDCVYVHVLGQPILVLGSLTASRELLSQRSVIYSSRPRLVMAGELVGFSKAMALMPYSSRFLDLRRLIQRELTGNALHKYWSLHEDESRILAKKVIEDPDRFLEHIRYYAGSIILRVTYGYQTAPEHDKYLTLAEKVMAAFSLASQPGAWAVDIIPMLRYLPSWVSFHRQAAVWARLHLDVVESPFDWALESQQDSADIIRPNFVSTVLSQSSSPLSEADKSLLLWASASLFGGGADTTVAALSTFFLAMGLYPDVQAKAHIEIDRVVGKDRLPGLSDRASLPYVECLMKEVLRWNPLGPLGLPHLSTKDDVYRDYHLPAGTIVMTNVWSIFHDATIFAKPFEFQPERFIDNEEALDTVGIIFGFGRRSCPGINFAESSMFIAIATILAQCHISDPIGLDGKPVPRDVEYQTGTISHPKKFRCRISSRSATL